MTRNRAELDQVSDRVDTICGYLQEVELPPVDGIITYAVLHHCHPLSGLIPDLLRCLKPGGWFATVEPFAGTRSLEWLRARSGVPADPVDEGERKLVTADVEYIRSHLDQPRTIPFHLTARLERMIGASNWLRRLDYAALHLTTLNTFVGIVLISGKNKAEHSPS